MDTYRIESKTVDGTLWTTSDRGGKKFSADERWCRASDVERLEIKNKGLHSWASHEEKKCREYAARVEKMLLRLVITNVVSGSIIGWFIVAPQIEKLIAYMGWL